MNKEYIERVQDELAMMALMANAKMSDYTTERKSNITPKKKKRKKKKKTHR